MNDVWLKRWGPLLLAGLALVVFAPTLANGFTNWDDPAYAQSGPFVSQGWSGIWAAFTTPYDGAYAPLSHALLVVMHQLGGGQALPFHLLQWLLWGLTAAVLPAALRAVSVSAWVAVAAAALWLVHPFRVESVSWVANTKDTTSAFLVVAAFAGYGHGRRFGAMLLLVAAALANASVLPFAGVFAVLEWRRAGRAGWPYVMAFALPALALGLLAVSVHRSALAPVRSWAWQTPLITPWWYVARLLWPSGSRAVYDWATPSLASGWGLTAMIGWGLAAAVVGAAIRRPAWRRWLAGGGVALAALLPFSGLVSQRFVVAERYTLWPSLVLAMGVAWLVAQSSRWRWPLLALLVAALSVLTVLRQREWRDGVSLWASNVALEPSAFTVQYNYAGALGGGGRFDEAYSALQRARERVPRYPNLDCAMAMARAGRDQVDVGWATQTLPEVCALKPEERWSVAQALLKARDPKARIILEELDLGPKRAQAAGAAAALSLEQNDAPTALALAGLALSWQPAYEPPRVTQALALLQLGQFEQVLTVSERTPADARVAARLQGVRATALFRMGRLDEAGRLLAESVSALRALGDEVPLGQ